MIKLKLVTLVLTTTFFISNQLKAQSDDIRIKEYYWVTPLNKVLNDFQHKYGIQIVYDSTFTAKFKFSDKGRYGADGTTVERAFNSICNDIPQLSFYINEDQVVYLEKKELSTKKVEIANSKYLGPAEKHDITLSGVITDAQTGESLPFASIKVRGSTNGTSTNMDGYYTLFKVPTDTTALEVNYMGYTPITYFLNPQMELSEVNISLTPSTASLKEVVIETQREELMSTSDRISVVKMSPKKMAVLPNVGEKDIFRSFQLLPGISGSNEASSGLFVRGGTPDQNLVLYDGFTVYHVDHLFGMFSAFNSNAIKDVQLHKGGFESQFGGRISSVMEIIGKDGNKNDFNIGADIGLLSANVFTEFPIKDKTTVLLAARRSWKSPLYNSIFNNFSSANQSESVIPASNGKGNRTTESATPTSYFYDLNAKITHQLSKKDILSYSFFNGQDDLDNSRTINRTRNGMAISGGVNDITQWGNWGMSTTWSRKWNNLFYSNALVSMSNYYSNRELTSSRVITDPDGVASELSRGSIEDNNLRDYTFKLNNELKLGKSNQLEFGFQATDYTIDYDYVLNDSITIQQRHDNGVVTSAFLQDKIKLFNRITLTPGIRTSYCDVTGKFYHEPRASAHINLTEKLKIKGAWGHYYQFANRIIRNDISSGSRDFWVLSNDENIPVSFSEHFIAGASYETKGYLFDVEAYYKKLEGLSEYSLQFAPSFTNVNFDEFFYQGTGTARGVEFLFQKKFGKYNGWVGYTLGEVLYDFPIYGDEPFYANHDVTNEFKLVNTYKLKDWTFAATWIYATGKPYTEPTGGYTLTLLDGSTEDFITIGERNSVRYPDYHRLDVSATRDFEMNNGGKGSLSFSIFNLYNRKNIWYKEFEVEDGELIETDINLLGITPSITLSLKLR